MLDRTETERLFRQLAVRMNHTASQLLGDDEEARDVVSDIFERLVDGTLQLPREKPESYLLVCVRNRCLDLIRRLSVRQRMERSLTMSTPTPTSADTERELAGEVVAYARKTFAPLTWSIFRLRFDEEQSYRDIARHLDVSEATVYNHLAQALRQLRQRFNPVRQ